MKRTKRGIEIDKKRRAKVPKNKVTWQRNPNRYDWPGIDLPGSYNRTIGFPSEKTKKSVALTNKELMKLKPLHQEIERRGTMTYNQIYKQGYSKRDIGGLKHRGLIYEPIKGKIKIAKY